MIKRQNQTLFIVLGLILLVGIFIFWWNYNSTKTPNGGAGVQNDADDVDVDLVEGFQGLNGGANTNVGVLLDDAYDLVKNSAPAASYADLVAQGDHLKEYQHQPDSAEKSLRPMERLHRVSGKALMPRTSLSVTPFNIDVASPQSQMYSVNTPRVSFIKGNNYQFSASLAIRGDIPINYNPNVPLLAKSRYGRDSQTSGLFTPAGVALFAQYSGKSNKNLVTKIAGGGQAGGYGGASAGVIMDNYN